MEGNQTATSLALAGRCPDFRFIREKVPLAEVARDLGVEVKNDNYRAHCWRPENHRNGDRDPSVRFQKKKNRGRCFVCDEHAWSNIDLVMMVMGCDMTQAVCWIANRFAVPSLKEGQHINRRQQWNSAYRVGTTGSVFEMLVRSGFWADMTYPEQSILVVLDAFTDSETGVAEVSYRGLRRFGRVRSPTSVARAIKRFQRVGLLHVERGADAGFRSCNRYRLTFEDTKFRDVLNAIYRRQQEEIEVERKFRAERRKLLRSKKHVDHPVKVIPVSTQSSGAKLDGIPNL